MTFSQFLFSILPGEHKSTTKCEYKGYLIFQNKEMDNCFISVWWVFCALSCIFRHYLSYHSLAITLFAFTTLQFIFYDFLLWVILKIYIFKTIRQNSLNTFLPFRNEFLHQILLMIKVFRFQRKILQRLYWNI